MRSHSSSPSLSHELRTPLQSITGFTESLTTLDLSPDRRQRALAGISNAAAHILAIVDDVLDLARVEAGAMPIALEPIDAAAVAAATVELLQPLSSARGIIVECDGPSAVVIADRRRLQQVLLNLVSNALRFSPTGTVVSVRTEVTSGRVAGLARIHVTDQGPGISEDLLARLFVPFDRLGADAGREGGAGLGLVLARRLTEAMGGSLDLASTVGVGTHVTIALETPA